MGIVESKSFKYWNYFLALESDVVNLTRYIEFTDDNYDTYSIEIAKIILSTASEVDVIAKNLCNLIDSKSKASSIGLYRKVLLKHNDEYFKVRVSMLRYGMTLTPWYNWKRDEPPLWWTDYNKIKHHRHKNFHRANLKNMLNALAGLFVLVIDYHLMQSPDQALFPKSKLFYRDDLLYRSPNIWCDNY